MGHYTRSLASSDKALAIKPDYADRGITVDGYSLSSDWMSKQLPCMTKGLPSTWIMPVRGSSAVQNLVFADGLRKPSDLSVKVVSNEEPTRDKNKKGIYF